MAAEAVGAVADDQSAKDNIFALVLKHKEYFLGQLGGLPDVRGFLQVAADPLRLFLEERWTRLLCGSPAPLVVNILINPNLLFCDRDAMLGQYSKYFRPVYLDPQAIRIDKGEIGIPDPAAQAIVRLHRTFDHHYDEDLASRPFLSLNDIETLLVDKGTTTPLPPANKVISISRTDARSWPFRILCDHDEYKDAIDKALHKSGAPKAIDRLKRYLEQVTEHQGSYHHVTFGSDSNWVGRVYLAFRNGDAHPDRHEWIVGVKDFAYVVLAPLALAGTFLRNPGIVSMLGDVHELLLQSHETGRRHSSTFEQFFGSAAHASRKLFPTIDDILTTQLKELAVRPRNGLYHVREHSLLCPGWCKGRPTETITHALEYCNDGAGLAFIADISESVKNVPAFRNLPADTVTYLGNALTFGLSEDTNRPKDLNREWQRRSIDKDWVTRVQTYEDLDRIDIPKRIRPFIRALLLMTGNHTMVQSDASRIGIKLENAVPMLTPISKDFLVTVEYSASGELMKPENKELDSPRGDALNANKNGLLVHFGRHFLSDFRMCIATTMNDKVVGSTYRWVGPLPGKNGAITYGFRFAR